MANTMALTSVAVLCLLSVVSVKADDHGSDSYSLDADSFGPAIDKNRNFVMFYAPWCGHCKNLAPTWNELAKVYNKMDDAPVFISKVDCTVERELCAEHDITGFPTLKLFEKGGESQKRYTGKRDMDSLRSFLKTHVQGEAAQVEAEEEAADKPDAPKPKSTLITLDDDSFETLVAEGLFFIKFYAPWCGHCKKLAPVWDDLAETFNHMDGGVSIAKIDCTQNSVTCNKYNIRGYPTLLVFRDGEKVDQYQGPRSHEALKSYVSDQMALRDDKQEEQQAEETLEVKFVEGEVADLTVDTYKTHLEESELVFVKFFAPWCGHCKRLAPTWEDLAKELETERVSIAKVDCTQHKSICDENGVRGYPTLKIFKNGAFAEDYKGSRSLEDLHGFVKRFLEHDEL